MKRVIAHILVCVMLLTNLQNVTLIKAAEFDASMGFKVERKMLKEGSQGLSVEERDSTTQETALASWDIGTGGKYRLSYYIEALSGASQETKKVNIDFTNSTTNEVNMQLTTETNGSIDPADANSYVEYTFDNASKQWSTTGTSHPTSNIEKTFKLGRGQARDEQEFNITISNIAVSMNNTTANLRLRFKVDDTKMYVYTTGVTKGNITPFELFFDGNAAAPQATTSIKKEEIFNGPKNYKITPTHLYKDGSGQLASKDIIDDIHVEKPGSVPGIKVGFTQVKVIDGNEFKYANEAGADHVSNITLQVGTRYTLNDLSNAIRIDFKPLNGEGVKINNAPVGEYSSNVVTVDGDKNVYFYISQRPVEGIATPKIIVHNDLKLNTSTIVDGSFQYGNQAEKYWPDNKGYTYLGYSLSKTSSNQVRLNITPYNIRANATYSIYVLNNSGTVLGTPQVEYEYDPHTTEANNITANIPTNVACYFKIVVGIDNNKFESQMVYYDPNRFTTEPEVTTITTVDNVYVVPGEHNIEHPQAIGFDIAWKAPNDLIPLLQNTGDLYYELLLRKDKDDHDPIENTTGLTDDVYATYSKIFKVSLDAHNQVQVTAVSGTAGNTTGEPEVRYNEHSGIFKMENVSLMNYDPTGSNKWEQIVLNENHLDATASEYRTNVTDKQQDILINRPVPGTYYLSFRTVLVPKVDTAHVVYSEESNMVSLTLDNSNDIIPAPSTITPTDTTPADRSVVSEKITINNVDIKSYVKRMLEPAHLYLYKDLAKTTGRFSGAYEVYLYKDSKEVANVAEKVKKGEITPIEVDADHPLTLTNEDKEKLKDKGVIPIIIQSTELAGNGAVNFEIKGLDENEVYYIQTRVKLSPWRNSLDEMNSADIPARYSLFSREVSFTTSDIPKPPSPDDQVPPRPSEIGIQKDENGNEKLTSTTVGLYWTPPEFEEETTIQKTYYELIRTEDKLTTEETSKTVETLVNAANNDSPRVGFRSISADETGYVISTYTNKNGAWTDLSPQQYNAPESTEFKLTDDTLSPNKLYYYYVRTVCIINGAPVKSEWIMVPVTTSTVGKPINLKVELAKDYSYDAKKETVISFDAPVPSADLVPSSYDFDIAVEGEMDNEYSTSKYSVTKLTPKETGALPPQGYTHFVYKITGLKPNKRYNIKVRLIDKTHEPEVSGQYPTSLYTDPVSTRTEYDEGEANKDDKYDKYIHQFELQAEELRKSPYWEVEDGTTYKYRQNYLVSDLGLKHEYDLVVDETQEANYYIPLAAFTEANSLNTTLNITLGDYTASIRPYTLTEESDAIKKAVELKEDGELVDYYVKLSFTLDEANNTTINGQAAITPEMNIEMSVIYLKKTDEVVEADIEEALADLITDEKKNLIKKLDREIYKEGTISDEILRDIIKDSLEDIKASHAKKVKNIISKATKKTVEIDTIEKPVLLIAVVDVFAVDGYYKNGGTWVSVDSYSALNGFAIEAKWLGTYIMTGQKALINTVPSMAPYQAFIAKYNLTDFFTMDSYMIKTATTKDQLYGAVARILGADRGTDYYTYLKSKNIKGLSNLTRKNAVRQDEAIYIVMQAYEKIKNRPINTIAIKNRQSVRNIGAFQNVYRDYVYAAVELKIVTPTDAVVLPSKQMTAEETIIMLYKMQSR